MTGPRARGRAIAEQITEQKGDYVLALTENQGSFYENVEDSFRLAQQEQFRNIAFDFEQSVEKAHGRLEIRKHWIIDDLEHLNYLDEVGKRQAGAPSISYKFWMGFIRCDCPDHNLFSPRLSLIS